MDSTCVRVELGERSYDVIVGSGLIAEAGRRIAAAAGRGRVAIWMRQRVPLLPGETPSPLQRVLAAADSGSGISFLVDPQRVTFLNADLAVHLHRPLEGEWVGLDSVTVPDPLGFGLAETRLHDTRGPIGFALQSLVFEARP